MSIHYLIDYENVHEAGLSGMQDLTAQDSIYIFHTSMNDRISLSCLDHIQAWVRVILVPPGKQSLDMHLGSFLGYLIGKEESADAQYAIVSHDTDYRKIADFWNNAYRMEDKVTLVHFRGCPHTQRIEQEQRVASFDCGDDSAAIRKRIIQIFKIYGVASSYKIPCLLVSELCSLLNSSNEYLHDRARLGKKPLQYLQEECGDILRIIRRGKQDWAYLLIKESEAESQAPEREAVQQPEAIPVQEEEDPGFMELGDLSIDDDILPAGKETEKKEPEEEEPAVKEPENPYFLDAARECLQRAGEEERNSSGHVRASAVRDELTAIPEFRIALKSSGMKPIPYLESLFRGKIRIYREKGIWWAADADEPKEETAAAKEDTCSANSEKAIGEWKENFYLKAYENVRKQLKQTDLDETITEEIANICMRARSAVEPRKVIHTMMCQRFGIKAGVQYYRKAVKYITV